MRHSTERCHCGTEVHLKDFTDRQMGRNGGIPWWSLEMGSLVFGHFSIIFQCDFYCPETLVIQLPKKLRFFPRFRPRRSCTRSALEWPPAVWYLLLDHGAAALATWRFRHSAVKWWMDVGPPINLSGTCWVTKNMEKPKKYPNIIGHHASSDNCWATITAAPQKYFWWILPQIKSSLCRCCVAKEHQLEAVLFNWFHNLWAYDLTSTSSD